MDSPSTDIPNLPDDIAALHALVLATRSEREAVATERDFLLAQNDRLRHLVLKLTRMQFGAKSERLPEDQLQLGLEALEQAIAKEDAQVEQQDPALRRDNTAKRRASRGALPAHLPRIEVTLTPEDTACPCCRAAMTVIGEDTSERLDVIPAQFRVIVTRRPKLACRSCPGTVVQEAAPARLIEGGLPTEALVAHVLVARYADHLPLYRQAWMMERQGVLIDRATLSFWMGYAAAEVVPVVARLREMLLASTRIFADETVVPVLDPGRGRTKQGYVWAIGRDDRPVGRDATARGGLQLCARPGSSPRHHAARRLPRHSAVRWLWGLQEAGWVEIRCHPDHTGILLEPRATGLLRSGQGADRHRSPATHCRALRDRGAYPWQNRSRTIGRASG